MTTHYGVSQRTDNEGYVELTGTAKLDGAELWLLAKPKANRELLRIVVKAARRPREPRSECSLELMVNGEKRDLGKLARQSSDGFETLSAYVAVESVAALVDAERVAGRVCDLRFMLEGEQKAVVREFVTRFREELAWDAPAASDAAPPAPTATTALPAES